MFFEIIKFGFNYSKPFTVFLVLVLLVYFDEILNFVLNILASIGLGSTLRLESIDEGSGRFIAWRFAWVEIQRTALILGKGLGYDEYFMRKNFNTLSKLGHEGGVHNTYLILWLNTGLVGLILYFSAFFWLFIDAFKDNKYAFPTMVAVLTSISYEPWLSASLNPYTSIFLVIISLMLYDAKKEI